MHTFLGYSTRPCSRFEAAGHAKQRAWGLGGGHACAAGVFSIDTLREPRGSSVVPSSESPLALRQVARFQVEG